MTAHDNEENGRHLPVFLHTFHPLSVFTLVLQVAFCLACGPRLAASAELVRDEQLIFDLLHEGTLVLSGDVAKALAAEHSQRTIRRVGLEKDGLMIRAAFRDKVVRVDDRDSHGERYMDAYYNELAAYVISRYLGLNIVPPTVLRSIPIAARGLKPDPDPREGTLQLWVENAVVEYDLQRGSAEYPGDLKNRDRQLREILVFDCIIGNVDRHAGNLLIDFNPRFSSTGESDGRARPYLGKVWAIDHTRAFHRSGRVNSMHCRLRNLGRDAISLVFIRHIRSWQLPEVEQALRASGLSDQQLEQLNLDSLDRRLQGVKQHFDKVQQRSGTGDEEFYSSGVWHRVR